MYLKGALNKREGSFWRGGGEFEAWSDHIIDAHTHINKMTIILICYHIQMQVFKWPPSGQGRNEMDVNIDVHILILSTTVAPNEYIYLNADFEQCKMEEGVLCAIFRVCL